MSSVTVNVIPSPSSAEASAIVRVGKSSLRIVPVAVSVAVTSSALVNRVTVNVSSASTSESSVVQIVNVCVSFAVPAKLTILARPWRGVSV